jgi:hypothetical protein
MIQPKKKKKVEVMMVYISREVQMQRQLSNSSCVSDANPITAKFRCLAPHAIWSMPEKE